MFENPTIMDWNHVKGEYPYQKKKNKNQLQATIGQEIKPHLRMIITNKI